MSALTYLLAKKWKNIFMVIAKNPIYLASVLGIGVFYFLSIGLSAALTDGGMIQRDKTEFLAIVIMLYLQVFILLMKNSVESGAAVFVMSDVNMLFPAPFTPMRILRYGLTQQVSYAFLTGILFVTQYPIVTDVYHVSGWEFLIVLIGFAITILLAQSLSMLVFIYTTAEDKKRNVIRVLYYVMMVGMYVYLFAYMAQASGRIMERAIHGINSLPMLLYPVAGWVGMFMYGMLLDKPLYMLGGLGLLLLTAIVIGIVLHFSKQDYYEDVLTTAEITRATMSARRDGDPGDVAPRHIKVGKIGIGKGWGASAFFYKHRLENRRSSVWLLSSTGLLFAVIIVGFAWLSGETSLLGLFFLSVYMQMISLSLGRLLKELIKPYIYLVPASSTKKLLYSILEAIPSSLAESLLIFIPLYFLLNESVLRILLCILCRTTFGLLVVAGNVLVERLFNGILPRQVLMILYTVMFMLLSLPGIAAGVGLYLLQPGSDILCTILIGISVVNIPMSLLILYLSRNLLESA